MPRTAATRRPARASGTPAASMVPAFMPGFTVSQQAATLHPAPRTAAPSALTASLRRPTVAPVRRTSPRASASTFFTTLKVGDGKDISNLLAAASPEQLVQEDRNGNNALHYLAQNETLNPRAFAELMFLYGDDIEYKPDMNGKTPLAVVLARHPNFAFIQALLGEESDFNRVSKNNKTMVHYLFKNTKVPIEDMAYLTTQLLEAEINKDKLGSALPILAKNLIKRYDTPSPQRIGQTVPKVATKQDTAVKLFNDMVLYLGFGEENQEAFTQTLEVLKKAILDPKEAQNKARIEFIKDLAKPLFTGQTQLEGKTKENYGVLTRGGAKKKRAARATAKMKAKP